MDKEKFTTATDKYKNMVYRIALNYLRVPSDADDVVQDAFLKLYTYKKEFESEEHMRNWLIRVSANICKNALRSPWRKKRAEYDDLMSVTYFDTHEQSELYKQVMNLSEKYRVTLYLFYYEEMSVSDIAKVLKISQTSVTTRLSRARQLLKKEIEKEKSYV